MAATSNKRKKAVAATVAAAAILLGGTFAWTSISQTALNETIVDINPGGRLHNDFNGSTLDIYAENFNEGTDAVPIYARVMLTEYMEIGQEAGKDQIADDVRKALPVDGGTLTDQDNWDIYKPTEDTIENPANKYSKYWTWTMGNDSTDNHYYMPTFNKNKDSLAADINGTYDGTVEDDIVHYDDYIAYDADYPEVTKDATFDWDDDTLDEGHLEYTGPEQTIRANADDPWDSADIYLAEEIHKAATLTSTAQVITIKAWQGLTDKEKEDNAYWVYDTDGWAYWSKAIQPGETTGLLMDGISMKKVPDDNWYYGINAIGQFATAGDLSGFNEPNEPAKDVFDSAGNGGGMSDAAKDLMAEITELGQTLTIETGNGSKTITPGGTTTITATEKSAGMELEEQPEITWNVTATDPEGNDVSDKITFDEETGELTVDEDVPDGTTITVKAATDEDTPVEAEIKLTVVTPEPTPWDYLPEYEEQELLGAFQRLGQDEFGNFSTQKHREYMLISEVGIAFEDQMGADSYQAGFYNKDGLIDDPSLHWYAHGEMDNRGASGNWGIYAPVGTKPGDEFILLLTYEKDGTTYGGTLSYIWDGPEVTEACWAEPEDADGDGIVDFTEDDSIVFVAGVTPDGYDGIEDTSRWTIAEFGWECTDPDAVLKADLFVYVDGKELPLSAYKQRSVQVIDEADFYGGSGGFTICVPDDVEAEETLTYVLIYELDGEVYGKKIDYVWPGPTTDDTTTP